MTAQSQAENISQDQKADKRKWPKILGIILVVLSFLLYFVIVPLPFTPFPVHIKGLIFVILVVIKDICLGLGIIILGKEFFGKYLKYLHIFDWVKSKFNKS